MILIEIRIRQYADNNYLSQMLETDMAKLRNHLIFLYFKLFFSYRQIAAANTVKYRDSELKPS